MKVFWCHCGRGHGNFGDRLTPFLLDYFGISYEWAPPQRAELFGIGSIIQEVPDNFAGVIWSSGTIDAAYERDLTRARVMAVRGALTLERLQFATKSDVCLGDGGLLCYLFQSSPLKRYKLGVIPHYTQVDHPSIVALANRSAEITVIDICGEMREVIRTVEKCEHIISSSLHGLILADSLGVPNRWVEFEPGTSLVLGRGFKFRDYYSAFGMADMEPLALNADETLETVLSRLGVFRRPGIEQRQQLLFHTFQQLLESQSSAWMSLALPQWQEREDYFLARLPATGFRKTAEVDTVSAVAAANASTQSLSAAMETLTASPEQLQQFIQECLDLIGELKSRGIAHRNIGLPSFCITDGKPHLIDLGWATSVQPDSQTKPPACGKTVSPNWHSYDVKALGEVFEQINNHRYPRLDWVTELMTACESERVTDVAQLKVLFSAAHSTSNRATAALTRNGDVEIQMLLEQLSRKKRSLSEMAAELFRVQAQVESLRLTLAVNEISQNISAGEPFILVDNGEWGTLPIGNQRGIPFLERNDAYWGLPADDETAIQELERLRFAGACFLVFAWPSFWWFNHYTGFLDYLHTRYRCLLKSERVVIFDLSNNSSSEGKAVFNDQI